MEWFLESFAASAFLMHFYLKMQNFYIHQIEINRL